MGLTTTNTQQQELDRAFERFRAEVQSLLKPEPVKEERWRAKYNDAIIALFDRDDVAANACYYQTRELEKPRRDAYKRLIKRRDELRGFVSDGQIAVYPHAPSYQEGKWAGCGGRAASEFAFYDEFTCTQFCTEMSADLTTYFS